MGMRRIISTMQVSLDGMTGRPDGRTDFIGTGSDTFDWELFDQADACVLGRVMYPEYEQYWRTIKADPTKPMDWSGQPPTSDEVRYAEFADKTPHYVLSRTMSELDWPVAQPVSGVDAIRELRETDDGVIYVVGGAATVGAVIEAGLLDELRLTVHPLILGAGMSLFGKVSHEHHFDLVESIPLDAGRVRVVYRAVR
jgi:dihydrofolate reductase